MGFLGPVTRLGGVLVRPHDVHVEVLPDGGPGLDRSAHQDVAAGETADAASVTGVVTRTTRVGFEVRAEVTAGDEVVSVVVTRAEARTLGLAPGVAVRLSPPRAPRPDRRPSRRPGAWPSRSPAERSAAPAQAAAVGDDGPHARDRGTERRARHEDDREVDAGLEDRRRGGRLEPRTADAQAEDRAEEDADREERPVAGARRTAAGSTTDSISTSSPPAEAASSDAAPGVSSAPSPARRPRARRARARRARARRPQTRPRACSLGHDGVGRGGRVGAVPSGTRDCSSSRARPYPRFLGLPAESSPRTHRDPGPSDGTRVAGRGVASSAAPRRQAGVSRRSAPRRGSRTPASRRRASRSR